MLILRQSTSIDIRMGPFMDSTTGVDPETGVTLGAADQAEVLKENGADTAAMAGAFAAVTDSDGWYDYTAATGDVDTVGEVVFVVQDASVCLPVLVRAYVVEEAVYDAFYAAGALGFASIVAISNVESSLVVIKSNLVIANSDTAAIESELIVVHSDTAAIEASGGGGLTVPQASQLLAVQSDLVIAGSDTAAIEVAIAALPTAADNADATWDELRAGHVAVGTFGEEVIINYDFVGTTVFNGQVGSGITAIRADLVPVSSDTAAIEAAGGALTAPQASQLLAVQSDLVIVSSDTAAIEAGGGSLTVAQASQVLQTSSDLKVLNPTVAAATVSDIVSYLDANSTTQSDIESSLVIIKSDLIVATSDTAAIEAAGGGLTGPQASQLLAVQSDLIIVGSDLVIVVSDTTAIEAGGGSLTAAQASQLLAVQSDLVIVGSDLVIVVSDTTAIEAGGGSLTVAQASQLLQASSDLAVLNPSTQVQTASDVVSYLDANSSTQSNIESSLVILKSDTAAIESGGGSLTAAQASQLLAVQSDLVIVGSDTAAIEGAGGGLSGAQASQLLQVQSDLLLVGSDAAAIESELILVHSETTAIQASGGGGLTVAEASQLLQVHSDTDVIEAAGGGGLTAAQASQLVQVQSDLIIVGSDVIVHQGPLSDIESSLLIARADQATSVSQTTVIESNALAAAVALSDVESSLVIVKSDTAVSTSQTTVILSDAAALEQGVSDVESSLVVVRSDLVVMDDILSDLNEGIIYGAVVAGTLSTTSCTTDLSGYANDDLINRAIVFTGGVANGCGNSITDYTAASGLVEFSGGIATVPANGDPFKIV